MKAIVYDRYTDPDGLSLREVERPQPGPGQVLVRVAAAALNAFDWHQYRGDPRVMRAQSGLRVKQPRIVGADFAGTVEAVGPEVATIHVGDRVMAEAGMGGCAEYALAGADAVAVVPPAVTFEAAAASIMGGLTALQALRDTGELRAGQSVLVWGASGGVGHMAVQIARALGAARVDAVCSGANATMVRGLGADHVYDYTAEPVAGATYDLILDTVTTASVSELKPLLNPGGRVVTVGALGGGKLLGPLSPFVKRGVAARVRGVDVRLMLADANPDDLANLADWLADGALRPVIQSTYPLEHTAQACRDLEAGHVAGKLVIVVSA